MSFFGDLSHSATRAATHLIGRGDIEALLAGVLRDTSFKPCTPSDLVVVERSPTLFDLSAFEFDPHDSPDGKRSVSVTAELYGMGSSATRSSTHVLSESDVKAALTLAERFGRSGAPPRLSLGVALPETPPYDPMEFGDVTVTIARTIRNHRPKDPLRFGRLSVSLSSQVAGQRPRTGREVVAELSRVLHALRLDTSGPEALTVGLADGGRATLDVSSEADTLVISTWLPIINGRRTESVIEEALSAGCRVVKAVETQYVAAGATNPEHHGGIYGIEIRDPSEPFTLEDIRRLLSMWGGKVRGGVVSAVLSPEDYLALRDDFAAGGDPFGRWNISFYSRGVRDAAALADIRGRSLPSQYGVGTVTGPGGERLDVFVGYQGGAWKLAAYAHALDTDTAAVFGDLLGDPSLIAPRKKP